MASLVAQRVKNPPAMQETQAWSLGQEDPLEEEMTTHSSILVWKIPWTDEPGGPQSVGLQRVRHNWATNTFTSGGSVVKNLPANAGNTGGSRYHLCIGKVTWRRKWQPTTVFCLKNPINRGAWRTTVCAVAESETTELTCKWINRLFVLEHY